MEKEVDVKDKTETEAEDEDDAVKNQMKKKKKMSRILLEQKSKRLNIPASTSAAIFANLNRITGWSINRLEKTLRAIAQRKHSSTIKRDKRFPEHTIPHRSVNTCRTCEHNASRSFSFEEEVALDDEDGSRANTTPPCLVNQPVRNAVSTGSRSFFSFANLINLLL